MNFLQRLVARWWAVWAAARGLDNGVYVPLPRPRANPRETVTELVARADARGLADAQSRIVDGWSFGGPDDPVSDAFDPGYVHVLRHEAETAVRSLDEQQSVTEFRTANLRRLRDEHERNMDSARRMIARLTVREADLDAAIKAPPRPGPTVSEADLPVVSPDDVPWEGESEPLAPIWRVLILLGLIAAEIPVQFFVYRYYLVGVPGAAGLVWPLALSTSGYMVLGPWVAGVLLRGRQATGAERRIGWAILGLAVAWALLTVLLGLMRARVVAVSQLASAPMHITPATVAVMFVTLLTIIGVMAFMLGLARRHPFQEAYVRQRTLRDRMDLLNRTVALRINPAYREPDEAARVLADQDERAIREAYAAAEDAYFAALARGVGDPTFTEAVQQRRGLRTGSPPVPAQAPPPAAESVTDPAGEPAAGPGPAAGPDAAGGTDPAGPGPAAGSGPATDPAAESDLAAEPDEAGGEPDEAAADRVTVVDPPERY